MAVLKVLVCPGGGMKGERSVELRRQNCRINVESTDNPRDLQLSQIDLTSSPFLAHKVATCPQYRGLP
jgi:hypothetical protein